MESMGVLREVQGQTIWHSRLSFILPGFPSPAELACSNGRSRSMPHQPRLPSLLGALPDVSWARVLAAVAGRHCLWQPNGYVLHRNHGKKLEQVSHAYFPHQKNACVSSLRERTSFVLRGKWNLGGRLQALSSFVSGPSGRTTIGAFDVEHLVLT